MFTTKYVKEDLPTYSELYNEFWLKDYWVSRSFEPHDPKWQELDPYWMIPRYKVLLATACNQFNKMLYVDHSVNMKDLIYLFAAENRFDSDLNDAMTLHIGNSRIPVLIYSQASWGSHFAISREGFYKDPLSYSTYYKEKLVDEDHIPPIYELQNPNGSPNPFVIEDDHTKRIRVNDLQGKVEMHFVWNSTEGFYTHLGNPVDMIWDCTHPRFKDLLKIFMRPIEEALKTK